MPPKKDDKKKGAVLGNFKAGKPLKDILPPNSKAPREGTVVRQEGEPQINRQFQYEPMSQFPEWPGNDEAKAHDFSCKKDANDNEVLYEDNTKICLPPSFQEFMRGEDIWLRPDAYIREILHEQETDRLKAERRKQSKTRKAIRKANLMALGGAPSDITAEQQQLLDKNINLNVDKASIKVQKCVIASMQRLETEDEIKKRKEEEEKKAAAEKGAKKKAPPAKGQVPVEDPSDKPQLVSIPIENSLDLGFSMPSYTKWITSQFQLTKDRFIKDVNTNEKIWERIYPQQNGAPIVSPSGKYWVKIRFMGKERLVEIDDRMPCDFRSKPLFARTQNPQELWPQLLMKALFKVYSYKWYTSNASFEKEIGDGSIIYSLTGLIPEHITIKDFDSDGMQRFRKMLSDDWYFGHKAYITAYCGEEFRPKLPSQRTALTKMEVNQGSPEETKDDYSEFTASPGYDSSSKMLNKLKQSASMAITVTTGQKLKINKNPNASNVIPGFGYALMDIFENEFVDMDSIIKVKDQIEEEKSPFKSPQKRNGSPSRPRDSSITKDEYRRLRKEERLRLLEEIARREQQEPKQFSLLNIKTAVTRYPTINYVSPFSNDEIYEGKRCLLNHWRRTPVAEQARQQLIERTASPKKRATTTQTKFNLTMHSTQEPDHGLQVPQTTIDFNEKPEQKPRARALGGVWISSSDFPHAFQHLIVYHNPTRFRQNHNHADLWLDATSQFISNEKDIYIKLTVDEELFNQFKVENKIESTMTYQQLMQAPTSQQLAKESWDDGKADGLLPGEKRKAKPYAEDTLIAFTPNPTSKPYEILPRFYSRFLSVEQQAEDPKIDFSFTKYFEGITMKMLPHQFQTNTVWLKPIFNAPLGYHLFIGTMMRKIEIVSRQEYLSQQKHYFLKQYTADFLPQTAHKMNVFVKYDFKVADSETPININVGCQNDRYLLSYMRAKIVDKSQSLNPTSVLTFNNLNIQGLRLPKNDNGYTFIVEGMMPYNTPEGQIQIDLQSKSDSLAFEEIIGTEPVEYTDVYKPWKYGIIFKEKIVQSVVDNITTSINIRLLKNGKDLPREVSRAFRFEVLDNNKVIYSKKGINCLNISHIVFRANQGLPEQSEDPNQELKHNYVLQAIFDLDLWPEAKTVNDQTENISWVMKLFTSETIAIIKDTDKEDREKALKVSWETAEPGRAEKAAKSRAKYLIQQKHANKEELNDQELAILYEKRERVRKKDLEEQANVKGGKKAPPAKPDPKKGAKEKEPEIKKPVAPVEEEHLALPDPASHVNANIVEFLNHFKSSRLITIEQPNQIRKRSDSEKARITADKKVQRENEKAFHDAIIMDREADKEHREAFKKEVVQQVQAERTQYKEKLTQTIEARNKYREKIIKRNEKMQLLTDLLAQEKIDLNALQAAIDSAVEVGVRKDLIERGKKQQTWLKYCKEVEVLLAQAVAEKVKENLIAVLERIEKEQIQIDAKQLTDAKNVLSKMK